MPKISSFSIDSFNDDLDDYVVIEQAFERQTHGSGGNKGHHRKEEHPSRGKNTYNEIKKQNEEGGKENRKKEAEIYLLHKIKNIPQSENEEENDKKINAYADWVVDAVLHFPVIAKGDLTKKELKPKQREAITQLIEDDVLTEKQVTSNKPGGQNVNKVADGVSFTHEITGMGSESKNRREKLINEDSAYDKIVNLLEELVKNWKAYLYNVKPDKMKDEIIQFIKDHQQGKEDKEQHN